MPELTRRELVRRLAALACATAVPGLWASCAPASQPTESPATSMPEASPSGPLLPTETPEPTPIPRTPAATAEPAHLAVARGSEPGLIVERAIAALGGIERFVRPGYEVIVKPNICVASHTFEYAATTNPEVVAALVRLCLGAGAKRVRVMDQPFSGTAEAAYARSGIAEAVAAAGGQMEIMSRVKYREADIPRGKDLKSCRVYGDILDADLVINVPVAKTHSLTRVTLGGKNLLGVVADPGALHRNIGQRVADLVSLVRPALTVVDAVRTMVRSGPTGGSLDDVKLTNTVIASPDIVAADAYATRLFGGRPADVSYIKAAADMKLGTMDLSNVEIEELQVG